MVYDSVKEVLDSGEAAIRVSDAYEFVNLMKECEEYGYHWYNDMSTSYTIEQARRYMYPTNISKGYRGTLVFAAKKHIVPYSRVMQSGYTGFKC